MPAKPKPPAASIHLSIFLGGGPRKPPVVFHSDSVPLTPERMALLVQLIGPDNWKRQGPSRQVAWDDLQAAAARYFDTSN
jgi:hypothetical protein